MNNQPHDVYLKDIFDAALPYYLMVGAIALAVCFLGFLAFDHFLGGRQRRSRRSQGPPITIKDRLLRPFVAVMEGVALLRSRARQKARHKDREQRQAEQMRRVSGRTSRRN